MTFRRRELLVLLVLLVLLALLALGLGALRSTEPPAQDPLAAPAPVVRRAVVTPAIEPAEGTPVALAAPETTLVIVRADRRRVEIVRALARPIPWSAGPTGELTWVVDDATSGAELARGTTPLPARCDCPAADDATCERGGHGCVDLARHEVVVRAKLPHLVARERVRLLDAAGLELASALVEAP